MSQGTRVLLKRYVFRVQKISSKENVFGVQEFSSKENVFTEEDMASLPSLKMALFSSGWKEAVNLRLNHSICWKILKIFRKIWKCKYKYKYDWRNRSLRAVWKSSHILSTRGTFGRPLNWTWRLKILKTIWWTLRQNNKRVKRSMDGKH